jgi:hypothetical protein
MLLAEEKKMQERYAAVTEAAGKLYYAGVWELQGGGMPSEEQSALWEALRDALGLKPGTSPARTGV